MPYFLILLALFFVFPALAKNHQVAIVIDDIGYRATDAQVLTLPKNVTYSFLPHTPYGKRLAVKAHQRNSDILLHIPMEAKNGKKMGPGGLHSSMNEDSIRASLQKSFDEIPFAIGMNNHMGSLLTEKLQHMTWTMQFLKERQHLFLDSMTTQESKAGNIAQKLGLTTLRRQIFLDNQLSPQYISQQFNKLIAVAKAQHQAIAIAHPHPETVTALRKLLPLLAENNVELVPISQLLTRKTNSLNAQESAEE